MSKRRKILLSIGGITVFLLVGFISWGIYSGRFSSSAQIGPGYGGGGTQPPIGCRDGKIGDGSVRLVVECSGNCGNYPLNNVSAALWYPGAAGLCKSKSGTPPFTFDNLPIGYYDLIVQRSCPPGEPASYIREDGHCSTGRQRIYVNGGIDVKATMAPDEGALTVHIRKIIDPSTRPPGAGPMPTDCYDNEDGTWDCPAVAKLKCDKSGDPYNPYWLSGQSTYKFGGTSFKPGTTYTCYTDKGGKQSIDITGCNNDILWLYLP